MRVAAAGVLVLGTVVWPPIAARACLLDTVTVNTLDLKMHPERAVYRLGQTARVHVSASRPDDGDPTGSGTPTPAPVSAPAEDVYVAVMVSVRGVQAWGTAVTGADGKAVVRIVLRRSMRTGMARVHGAALVVRASTPCLTLHEVGYAAAAKLFRIRPG